jgi:putative ABC transport system permease protein
METLGQEIRIAVRSLIRARGFAALAVATLALALALEGSVLALLNAYLVRSLPYPSADRLYSVRYAEPPEYPPPGLERLDWTSVSDVAEHLIAWDLDVFYLVGGEHPEAAPGAWVTPGYMQGLGIRPARGRAFAAEEFEPGGPQVALISHGLWLNRFGGDSGIVGRRFEAYVSDRPNDPEIFTVVGVLPASFWHVNPYTEVLTPLRAPSYPYQVRLREGVPPEVAASRISALVKAGLIGLAPDWQVRVRSVHEEYAARIRPTLVAIGVSVTLVLLIAASNVAMLTLLRVMRRQKETAIRLALGAGRAAVVRPLLIESLLVVGAGATLGTLLAAIVTRWVAPVVQQQLGRAVPGGPATVSIDPGVMAALAGLSLLVALLMTLAPTIVASRQAPFATLRRDRRAGGDSVGGRRTRFGLVAVEVAGSVALVVGSGLMVRTVVEMVQVDLGLEPSGIVAANLGLRERTYPDRERQSAFYARFLAELDATPGIASTALSYPPPLAELQPRPVAAESRESTVHQAGVVAVTPAYFSLLGIPLLGGRGFSAQDRASSAPVALASRTLAGRLWPEGSAIGRTIRVMERRFGSPDTVTVSMTVVGIVGDVRHSPTDDETADVYVPLFQAPERSARVLVQASGPADRWLEELRRAAAAIDPEVTLGAARPLGEYAADQLARPRFLASLLSGFGFFALALALMGVYGVVAYVVEQREHEVAVRMAVGAGAPAVLGLFAREAAAVLLVGVAAGAVGAVMLGQVLETQLHGVPAIDPATLVGAAALVAAGCGVATWWPARRATRIDPARALREE